MGWPARLRSESEAILQVWERETRDRLHAAAIESPLVLRNALPQFLDRMADALEERGPADPGTVAATLRRAPLEASGAEHGRQRAEQTDYSLAAVAIEYHVLRRVIFSTLEAGGESLPPPVRDMIYDCLDAGIQLAMVEFSAITTDLLNSHIANLQIEKGLREVFVSRLTHDLRNPLSAISTAAELLAHVPTKESCERLVPRVLGNVRRMDGMITDLLDATRIRAGEQTELRIEQVDLVVLVREAITDNEMVHGPRFVFRAPATATGQWTRDALRRVVDNLVSNAVKYGDPASPVTVDIGASESDVTLTVHNRGAPIRPEDQATIFDQFQRGGVRHEAAGWGIGLSVVKHVVESHGGQVALESDLASGTTFQVRLPRDARNASPLLGAVARRT